MGRNSRNDNWNDKGIPTYWRDELKDILFEEGFDAVIKKLEEWFETEHAFLK